MKIVFQDPTFSFQLLRAISETYYKGADIGECLSTAYRIKEGDFESWHKEWLSTAQRVHKYADDSLAAGHKVHAKPIFALRIITEQQNFYLWTLKIQEFK